MSLKKQPRPGRAARPICPKCSAESPAGFTFCISCGSWLDPDAEPRTESTAQTTAPAAMSHPPALAEPSPPASGPPDAAGFAAHEPPSAPPVPPPAPVAPSPPPPPPPPPAPAAFPAAAAAAAAAPPSPAIPAPAPPGAPGTYPPPPPPGAPGAYPPPGYPPYAQPYYGMPYAPYPPPYGMPPPPAPPHPAGQAAPHPGWAPVPAPGVPASGQASTVPPGPAPAQQPPPLPGTYAWPPYPMYPYGGFPAPVVYRFGTAPPRFPVTSRFRLAPCPPALRLEPSTYVVTERATHGAVAALLGGAAAVILGLAYLSSPGPLTNWTQLFAYASGWAWVALLGAAAIAALRGNGVYTPAAMGGLSIASLGTFIASGRAGDPLLGFVITGSVIAMIAAVTDYVVKRPSRSIPLRDTDERPWPRWDPERKGAYAQAIGGLLLATGGIVTGVTESGAMPAFPADIVLGLVAFGLGAAVALAVPGDSVWMARRIWAAITGFVGLVSATLCGVGAPALPSSSYYFASQTTLAPDYLFHTAGGVLTVVGIGWIFAGALVQLVQPAGHVLVATSAADGPSAAPQPQPAPA